MDTIVIKVTKSEKTSALLQLLKSMDFVVSAEYVDTLVSARQLFEEANRAASRTSLTELTEAEILAEINAHRRGE